MKHIFANWKMYLDFDESMILTNALLQEKFDTDKIDLAVFPSALVVHEVALAMQSSPFDVGTQNVNWNQKGAYTGEISAHMFKGVGCKYALVGHSERRHVFGETDDDVRKKIEACFDAGLVPVVCIGETDEDGKENKREYRLKKQIMKAFDNLDLNGREIIVAYEPVWAIGTGNACNPDDADDVHGWIKIELSHYTNAKISVLYGGSVNDQNVLSYVARETIDGVLVGGASAKLETFLPLIRAVEKM